MVNNPSQMLNVAAAHRQRQLVREAELWYQATLAVAAKNERQSTLWVVIKDASGRISAASARWLVSARRAISSPVP